MPKEEKSVDNDRRIIAIQPLIRQLEKEMNEVKANHEWVQKEIYKKLVAVGMARQTYESLQNEYDEMLERHAERGTLHAAKEKELGELRAELEELLVPFDEQLALMKKELDELGELHFSRLKESMMPNGWSEEDCADAAANFVKNHAKHQRYQRSILVVERIRKCEYSIEQEENYGGMLSFSATPQ